MKLLLAVIASLARSSFLKWFGVSSERIEAFRTSGWRSLPRRSEPTLWFHASSVGELEMLMPLIQIASERKKQFGISIFSPSAMPFLDRLPKESVFTGYSPAENEWKEFLQHFKVDRVVVAKYEAWPGLWLASAQLNLTLTIINAQMRSSLAWVNRLFKVFKQKLPNLRFFALSEGSLNSLKNAFPEAEVQLASDPRWQRVLERSKNAQNHPRVAYYSQSHSTMSHPFGLVGSAWNEDLKRVVPAFKKVFEDKGTLWVVPHSLEAANVEELNRYLSDEIPGRFVLINEMGILAELYSIADWAWVGGGFGKGIHSTLEPAVYSVPIGCGPSKVDNFFETFELRHSGQLTVCSNENEVAKWMNTFQKLKPIEMKTKTENFSRMVEACIEGVK